MEANSGQFKKGQIPHNKGKHVPTGLVKSKDITGKKFNRWTAIKKTSKDKLGYWKWIFKCDCGNEKELSISTVSSGASKSCGCLKMEKLKKGHKHTLDTKFKLSLSHKGILNKSWKGGITSDVMKIRSSIEMKLWKKSVLERDNFTCQKTGKRGGKLAVHHINNFADFHELRTSIENGITLDFEVHKEFHRKYGIKNNTREQLLEFLNTK